MENKNFLDLNKYKNETIMSDTPMSSSMAPEQPMKTLDKEMLINAVDGRQNTTKIWFGLLSEGESLMVSCPISPESHNNNDANASCSMRKNGDFLNLKCFGCDGAASVRIGVSNEEQGEKKFKYYVPEFDKDAAIKELAKGLSNMTEIVTEFIRLLPPLEKVEKEEKKK